MEKKRLTSKSRSPKKTSDNDKPYHFTMDTALYPYTIVVAVGHNDKELEEKVLKKYPIGYKGYFDYPVCKARATLFDTRIILIRFRYLQSVDNGTIAHELFHATDYVLNGIGVVYDRDSSDEAYTYLLNYLVDQFYAKVKKHGRQVYYK